MVDYSATCLGYFHHRAHRGFKTRPEVPQEAQYRGRAGTPGVTDVIEFWICVDGNQCIQKARFQCYGNVATIAAASWLCTWSEGQPLSALQGLTPMRVIRVLDLPPKRHSSALLVVEAVKHLSTAVPAITA